MDTKNIIQILESSHDPNVWAFFVEMRIGTGFGKDSEARLDAWAINYHPSKRNVTRAYEVKISRGDFLSEIKKPLKKRHGLRLANEFFFVAPTGLIKPEEVPPECGLIEISESGKLVVKVKAPFRDIMPPTWLFLAAIARRKSKAEEKVVEVEKAAVIEANTNKSKLLLAIDVKLHEWGNAKSKSEHSEAICSVLKSLRNDALKS